jgi:hypothetical protein
LTPARALPENSGDASATVEAMRAALGARAAGFWRVEDDHLRLVVFAAAPDMPAAVAAGFAVATARVALDQADLSIVRAATEGRPAVARTAELSPDAGSGRWLRAFGAARSVAVPLGAAHGATVAVLSIALPDSCVLPDDAVAARVGEAGRRLIVESPR